MAASKLRTRPAMAFGACVVLVATACTGSDDDGDNADNGETPGAELSGEMRVLTYQAGSQRWDEPLQVAADNYMEQHPNTTINIETMPYEGYGEAIQTQLVGGTAPDLIHMEPPMVQALEGRDLLMAFDDALSAPSPYADAETWSDSFLPTTIDSQRDTAGNAVVVPFTSVWVGLFFNEQAYADAGIEAPPETWDEWMDVNTTLQNAGHLPLFTAIKPDDAQTWWITTTMLEAALRPNTEEINLRHADDWAWDPTDPASAATETYTADELYVAFQKGIIDPAKSQAYRDAIETVMDLQPFLNENALSTNNENDHVLEQFINQTTVQQLSGTFSVGNIDAQLADLGTSEAFDYDVANFPTVTGDNISGLTDGGTNPLVGVRNGWVVPAASENQELAIDFLRFITSTDELSTLYTIESEATGSAVTDPSVIDGVTYPEGFPEVDTALEFAEIPVYGFGLPPTFDTQDFDEFIAQWQGLFGGELSIDEFLNQRSASNLAALERNLDVFADEVDQEFIDSELGG